MASLAHIPDLYSWSIHDKVVWLQFYLNAIFLSCDLFLDREKVLPNLKFHMQLLSRWKV